MIGRRFFLLTSLFLMIAPALAQQGDDNNIRIMGVFEKLDGQHMTIKGADGNDMDIMVTAQTKFTRNQPSSLSAIKPGDFVASAAVTGDDGKLHSTEVRIFPPAMAGLGEGQRPMKDNNKTMTNASVSEVTAAASGGVLKVKFHGTESELVVGPEVPVTEIVIAQASELKPETKVFVTATQAGDDTLSATRVLAQ